MGLLKSSLVITTMLGFSLGALAQTSTSTTAASSTTTAAKVAPKPSKLSFRYLSETNVGVANMNRSEFQNVSNYHYVRAKYKTSNTESVELRQYFHTERVDAKNAEGQNVGRTDAYMGNTVVQYTNTKQGRFAGENLVSAARLYVPTGRDAQDNLTSQLRGYLIWAKPLAKKLTFEALLSPRLYASFRDQADQSGAAMVTSGDFQWKFNDTFSMNVNPYVYNVWRRAGPTKGNSNSDTAYINTGLTTNLTDKISMTTYIEQGRSLRARGENLYDENSSMYGLLLIANM